MYIYYTVYVHLLLFIKSEVVVVFYQDLPWTPTFVVFVAPTKGGYP